MTHAKIQFKHQSGQTIDLGLNFPSLTLLKESFTQSQETHSFLVEDSTNLQISVPISISLTTRPQKPLVNLGDDNGNSDPNSPDMCGVLARAVSMSLAQLLEEWASSRIPLQLKNQSSSVLNGWSIVGTPAWFGTSSEWWKLGAPHTGPTPEKNQEPAPNTQAAPMPSSVKHPRPSPTSVTTTKTTDTAPLSERVKSLESYQNLSFQMLATLVHLVEIAASGNEHLQHTQCDVLRRFEALSNGYVAGPTYP